MTGDGFLLAEGLRWRRRIVDGLLWEDDRADGPVVSGTAGAGPNLDNGMWKLKPGKNSSYEEMRLD